MASSNERQGAVIDSDSVEKNDVERADDIDIQWLISKDQGSDNIFMRKFTIKPGGSMGYHKHDETEHVQYVLKGTIELLMDGEKYTVSKGDAVFIPSDVPHSYENIGDKDAVFLCIIPSGEVHTEIIGK
ncbi:MAG: cupin domain-containing protein [Candidatus Saliniplasma sp.]